MSAGRLSPVCILAGGLGTRLGEHARDRPKALVEVAGRPFIEHQLEQVLWHGGSDVVLCVGHLGEQIEQVVGDGRSIGLSVQYAYDPPGLAGTAGAVRAALPLLGKRFLVLYGDTYLPIDFMAVDRAHERSKQPALMTVLENADRWQPSNATFDGRLVGRHDKRAPDPDMDWIDYGLGMFDQRAFALTDRTHKDLGDVYAQLAREGRLAGYAATHRFHDIGTPEALAETDAYLRTVP